MKIILQRVSQAAVSVDNKPIGKINHGVVLLVGIDKDDSIFEIEYLANKILNARIFPDNQKKMNLSIQDVSGELLIVSQFTICANTDKGRRPSFVKAMSPDLAQPIFDKFVEIVKTYNHKVVTGIFGANMDIELINKGPTTFIFEKRKKRNI